MGRTTVRQGQLGTEAQRRMIWIWEGAVASLPDKKAVRTWEKVKCNVGLWDQAVSYWEVSERGLAWMWAVLARTDYRVDVCVTTRPEGFAQAVAKRVEKENWPVRYVFARTAPELGKGLSTMPDVERVIYGLEEQRWAFGPQGYLLSQPGQLV